MFTLLFLLALSAPTVLLCRGLLFAPFPEATTYAPSIVLDVPDMPSTWEGFI